MTDYSYFDDPIEFGLKPGEEYRPGFIHRTLLRPVVLLGKGISNAYSGSYETGSLPFFG